MTAAPLLVRLDSAHDAGANRRWFEQQAAVDHLIKWNPRSENPESWLGRFEEKALWTAPREGKRIGIFSDFVAEHTGELDCDGKSISRQIRRVMRLIERTIDRRGQSLLLPQYTLEGWWTSLDGETASDADIIALYKDHATAEQFQSEFETDLDIERLPSGKFDTNDLVLAHATLAYNILRWIGPRGLLGTDALVRHPAKRQRLRTVMQELMYMAGRMIVSGRQLVLRVSSYCRGYAAYTRIYQQLASG